jgi:hypothetical protein
VIGEGQGRLVQLNGALYQLVNAAETIQKRILAVDVKVNEFLVILRHAGLIIPSKINRRFRSYTELQREDTEIGNRRLLREIEEILAL